MHPSTNEWLESFWCSVFNNELLFSFREEGDTVICDNVDELRGHSTGYSGARHTRTRTTSSYLYVEYENVKLMEAGSETGFEELENSGNGMM